MSDEEEEYEPPTFEESLEDIADSLAVIAGFFKQVEIIEEPIKKEDEDDNDRPSSIERH